MEVTRAELADMMEQCTTHLVNHAIVVNSDDRFHHVYFSKCALTIDGVSAGQFTECFFCDCRFYRNGVQTDPYQFVGPPVMVTDDRTALN